MLKSKLKKAALRINQNSSEVAQQLVFLPLVRLREGRAEVQREGAGLLEDQCQGRSFLVGYESASPTLLFTLYRSTSVLPPERPHSGIWIANYPRIDPLSDDQLFFLQIAAASAEDRTRLHVIASLLCAGIVVNLEEVGSLAHLSAVEGRVVHSGREKDENRNRLSRKHELAHLILLGRGKPRETAIRRDESQVYDVLSRSQLYDRCIELYSGISLLHAALDLPDPTHLDALEAEIRSSAVKNFGKAVELTSGPFLSWYLTQVVGSLNRTGMVDMEGCLQSIQLPSGYQGFQKGVELYHLRVGREMKEEGTAQLKEVLVEHREEAVEEFKKYSEEGSWLLRLCQYIEAKEERLLEENEKALELQNLTFLRNESKFLLDRVAKQKVSEAEAQKMVQKMIADYREAAHGQHRFELLSNCLTLLNPAIYKTINERESKTLQRSVDKEKQERKQLEDRVGELEENLRRERMKSEKCCEIM